MSMIRDSAIESLLPIRACIQDSRKLPSVRERSQLVRRVAQTHEKGGASHFQTIPGCSSNTLAR